MGAMRDGIGVFRPFFTLFRSIELAFFVSGMVLSGLPGVVISGSRRAWRYPGKVQEICLQNDYALSS